jgi:pSer/pThr/pTyr-binding forkhead associated (FHA) protein
VVQRPAAPEPIAAEAPAPTEVHCLEIEDGDLLIDPFIVDNSGVKIGRTAPADIVIPDKSVSREHCLIGIANDELLVTDLNSTNGTFIDGARISRASVLPVGSILRLGQVSLRHAVYSRSDEPAPAPRLAATS